MAERRVNDYGTGASEVKPSINRAVVRAKNAAQRAARKREAQRRRAEEKRRQMLIKLGVIDAPLSRVKSIHPATNVILQIGGTGIKYRTLVDRARRIWRESRPGEDIVSLDLYVKPEEGKVYCVFNGDVMMDYPIIE